MKKIVIWMVGSNASGKTTQAALIHKKFREGKFETNIVTGATEDNEPWSYTVCSKFTSNLGKFTHPILVQPELDRLLIELESLKELSKLNQNTDLQVKKVENRINYLKPVDCCGTDSMSKKVQIISAFNSLISSSKPFSSIIVVEGIMATGTWIEFLKTNKTIVLLVHLKIGLEDNLNRLADRRSGKKKILSENVEFSQKTIENISGKIKSFQSIYNRMKVLTDYCVEIDATKPKEQINKIILSKIQEIYENL